MKHKINLILALIFCCSLKSLQCQTTYCNPYETAINVNGLNIIPPYQQNMPLDCNIAYTAMDSIAKAFTKNDIINILSNISLDSLKLILRYRYAMTDFNPLLLRQYLYSTHDSIPGGTYKSFPANSYFGSERVIMKNLDLLGRDYSLLLMSDYILKVHIENMSFCEDSTYFSIGYPIN